jgi:hypothetical protein
MLAEIVGAVFDRPPGLATAFHGTARLATAGRPYGLTPVIMWLLAPTDHYVNMDIRQAFKGVLRCWRRL